jgi:apolipoprotein N-acyltransferase
MTRMGIVRGMRTIGVRCQTNPSIAAVLSGAIGGLMTALALPPQSMWPLAWVGLVPLWLAIIDDRPRGWQGQHRLRPALLTALAWGLAYYGWALRWLTGLHPLTWLGLPWSVSLVVTGLCWGIVVLWGAFQGLLWMGMMAQVVERVRSPLVRIAWGALIWCGLDWIWSLSPLYWPPLPLTQSPGNSVILHLAQLSGPNLITIAIVAVNGGWAWAWQSRRAGQTGWQAGLPIGLALFAGLHLVGAGLWLRPLADRPDQALTFGIIQGNIPTREKLTPEGIELGRDRYSQAYRTLTAQEPPIDGVILPEGALPYIWTDQARAESPLFAAIVQAQVPALVGAFGPGVGNQDQAQNQTRTYTQSLFILNGQGEEIGRYNKVKLVLLGEYIPGWLANWLGRLSPISATMEFGADRQRVQSPWGPIAVAICYEPAFSAVLRDQVAAGALFAVTSSNLDPYGLVLMAQHQAQDSLRAIETDRWIIRASNSGYSGAIDPHGQVQAQSAPQQFVSLRQRLYRRDSQTPYVRWGDRLTPVLALVLLALQILGQPPRRSTPTPPRDPNSRPDLQTGSIDPHSP